ncbi:hypothetical protein BABAYKA_00420 [Brevundimonas phage vB_BpoS-Babayka]|uniref:Uncharacterized protein n=1 Tax=Brevundimonas phage vB_BpoS-Babayka TaxID=2948596 RepID=A0A9E7MUN6_9CAUD|nr:hypothetical protein BABAYKA_00420 [Brevundimonas phage vB_BpoS-Babayka]
MRKVEERDVGRIVAAVYKQVEKTKARSKKRWTHYISADSVLEEIFSTDNAYIVGETYLVLYNIGTPWYAPPDVLFLEEKLVLHIGGGAGFSVVPAFLEQRAEAEGVHLVGVGTALAISDRSLCRVYSRYGFNPEVVTLIKETEP